MPFNPSTSVYTPPAGAENAVPGQLIQSVTWNTIHTDIAAALTAVSQGTQLFQYMQAGATATFAAQPPSTRLYAADNNMVRSGATANLTGEQVAGVFGIAQPTASTVSYEKNAVFACIFTQDPSDYGGTVVTRDAVGIDARGTILNGNMTGRAWGGYFQGDNQGVGSDGLSVGLEAAINNLSTFQPDPTSATITQKYNIIVSLYGTIAGGTAAIFFNGGGSASKVWQHGIYCPQSAISSGGYFLNYVSKFTVDDSGNIDAVGHLALNQPASVVANYTVLPVDSGIICGAACTLILPTATVYPGRSLLIKNTANATVVSSASNVIPLAGGAAATEILSGTAGKWATVIARGSNWVIMQGN